MLGLVIVIISIISSIYSLVRGSILIGIIREMTKVTRDMALPENKNQMDNLGNMYKGQLLAFAVFFIGAIIQFLFSIWFLSVDIYKIPAFTIVIFTIISIVYNLFTANKHNITGKYDLTKEKDIINFKVEYEKLIDSLNPKSFKNRILQFIFLLYYIYAFIILFYPQLISILIGIFI